MARNSNSNSSGSHSGFPAASNIFQPHLPESTAAVPLLRPYPPSQMSPTHNQHIYELRSSIGDNMTYSEVNSTADLRTDAGGNNREGETDCDEEEEEDNQSCSMYGQASSVGDLTFPHPLGYANQHAQARHSHESSMSPHA